MGLTKKIISFDERAEMCHIAPFVLWVLVMCLPIPNQSLRYAFQSLFSGIVLCIASPWRFYKPLLWRHLPLGLLVGFVVFAFWVFPESPWLKQSSRTIYDLYATYAIHGTGTPQPTAGSSFSPENCGWFLSLVRLGGSALVIAVAEEYFWRGFLMRWLQGRPFIRIDPKRISWGLLVVSSCLFGMEHSRWMAGTMAGFAYALFYRRTGDLAAVALSHGVTNALLGLYVLLTGAYQFW